jgi:hypothetical protein
MIQCDGCDIWCHTDCVGISAAEAETIDSFICPTCKSAPDEPEDMELHCVCKKPEGDGGDEMIQCDGCDIWCHTDCVGITPAEAETIDAFICPNCVAVPAVPLAPVATKQKRAARGRVREVEELHCICRTPEGDDGAVMIQCDGCDLWCHNSCVGMTSTEAQNAASFLCPSCKKSVVIAPVAPVAKKMRKVAAPTDGVVVAAPAAALEVDMQQHKTVFEKATALLAHFAQFAR